MENLWTPWRMGYILENKTRTGCLFCGLLKGPGDPPYLLHRGRLGFLILNVYPYTSGHVMAIPYDHVPSLGRMDRSAREELLSLASAGEKALVRAYGCDRVLAGVNVGRCAGAGVEGHVHIHLVPRRWGDAARSRTSADPHGLPETLEVTFRKVQQALALATS